MQKYFSNTVWLFVDKLLKMIVSFVVGVYVIRYLGPERYGILSYYLSFVALFGAFFSLGLEGLIVKHLVENTYTQEEILGSGLLLRFFGGSIGCVLVLSINYILQSESSNTGVLVLVLFGYCFQTFQLISYAYQAEVKSKNVVICQQVAAFTSMILKVLGVYTQSSIIFFAGIFCLENLLQLLFLQYQYSRDFGSLFSWKINWILVKSLIYSALPLILSGIVTSVYLSIDQVMIRQYLGVDDVGVYSVCVRLSEIWYFVPTLVCSSLYPAIVAARQVSKKEFEAKLCLLYEVLFFVAICIALPIIFCAGDFVELVYGVSYSGAALPLTVHILSTPLVYFIIASGKYLIIEDVTHITFIRGLVGTMSNVLLNLLLIPKYGILGAAIATTGAYICLILSMLFTKARGQLLLQIYSLFPNQTYHFIKAKLKA